MGHHDHRDQLELMKTKPSKRIQRQIRGSTKGKEGHTVHSLNGLQFAPNKLVSGRFYKNEF